MRQVEICPLNNDGTPNEEHEVKLIKVDEVSESFTSYDFDSSREEKKASHQAMSSDGDKAHMSVKRKPTHAEKMRRRSRTQIQDKAQKLKDKRKSGGEVSKNELTPGDDNKSKKATSTKTVT